MKKIQEQIKNIKKFFISMISSQFKRLRYKFWLFMTNKKFDLKEHGDSVEKQKYEQIVNLLPSYQEFWSLYIGHDQKGNICKSNIVDNILEEKRRYVGQLYYSIVKKFIELEKLKTELLSFVNVDDVDRYLESTSKISSYLSTFGQIFDKEMKILNQLFNNDNRKAKQGICQEYYSGIRNFEQHSSDIPIIINEELISIPNTAFLKDNDKQSWFEPIEENDVIFLDDFVNKLFDDLKKQINNNISSVKQWFKDNVKDFQFIYPDLTKKDTNIMLSAVTGTYNYVSGIPQENRRQRRKKK